MRIRTVRMKQWTWGAGALAALFLLAGSVSACRSEAPRATEVEVLGVAVPTSTPEVQLAGREAAVPTTGGAEAALARVDPLAQASDEEPKDYWAAITFDRTNFEDVRKFIRERYIERRIDQPRAYAEAAAFALASDEERVLLLLPEAFYKERKDHPDEKGRLSGKMTRLGDRDRFVIVEEVEPEEDEIKRRLSDAEIKELRRKAEDRTRLLDSTWKAATFDVGDFDRVMAYASRTLGKSPKWSMKKSWIAAAQGYLYSLDPHSSLIAKAAWEDSTREITDSSFEGIGAILTRRPDSEFTIVESPIDEQPAVKAGLRAGDVILEVDGKSIKGEELPKVVSRIRGKKGTTVVLTIERVGMPEAFDVPIRRARIDIKNVQGRLIKDHDGLATIKVSGFVPTTSREFDREYERLADANGAPLRGLVLDLRNNSGGLLRQGIELADRFLSSGVIVSVQSRGEADETHSATPHGTLDVPLVVLVNDGAASASEIVASALQDGGRAIIVGDRTFGKASVQTLFSPLVRDDYYIKLTVARYYSPSGRTLQVVGVKPDVMAPPEVGGEMPLGFREENLSHHLRPLDSDYSSATEAMARQMVACADAGGVAEELHAKDPNPAVKFDYQLMRAADLLECVAAPRTAKQGRPATGSQDGASPRMQ